MRITFANSPKAFFLITKFANHKVMMTWFAICTTFHLWDSLKSKEVGDG